VGGWGDADVVDPAKSRRHDHAALGTACVLVGSTFLLLGVANPLDARTSGMAAGLLFGVSFLLLGVALLLLGVAALLDTWRLVGVPFLLFGVAALLGGVAALLDGWTVVGVALLVGPVTALLLGVALLLDRWTLLGFPFLMAAVVAMLGGVAALLAGLMLLGVAALLFGVAFLLLGVAALRDGWTLVGISFLLLGIAALLGVVAALVDGWTVVGIPSLLLGIAALQGGVALLYRPEFPRRLVAWVTKRNDLPPMADRDVRDLLDQEVGHVDIVGEAGPHDLGPRWSYAGGLNGTMLGYPAWEDMAMVSTITTGSKILAMGDFRHFVIVDRLAWISKWWANLFDANMRPMAQRGIYAMWRNTLKVLDANAFRVLVAGWSGELIMTEVKCKIGALWLFLVLLVVDLGQSPEINIVSGQSSA
jgi:hypothetical protein